ncbi:MAG: hypothetical protein ABI684_04675 [Nitrospirota bacterium]
MRKQYHANLPVARVANRIVLGHWHGVRESIRRNALSINGEVPPLEAYLEGTRTNAQGPDRRGEWFIQPRPLASTLGW